MKKSDITILVADDDPDYLFQVVFNLEKAGYRTVAVESQAEAEFVRIKNEKTRNISGSGLGLSIVKKVVELYHGTINVDSTPDVGTVFTIRLPKKPITIT